MKPNTLLFLLAVIATLLSCTSQADPLVGTWRSEPATNTTIQFSKDGSLHMNTVTRVAGQEVSVPFRGTYKIVTTNTLLIELLPAPGALTNKQPFSASYSLSGDELILQNWMSLEGGTTKYRRIKK
jgi:hypothetical protein